MWSTAVGHKVSVITVLRVGKVFICLPAGKARISNSKNSGENISTYVESTKTVLYLIQPGATRTCHIGQLLLWILL